MLFNWYRVRKAWAHWEAWPFVARYIAIMPVWLWYCLRARSLWFFTPSNPRITFGGFEGEGKEEMYQLLPAHLYPTTVFIEAQETWHGVLKKLADSGLRFPICAKPDVGMSGVLFRKLDDINALNIYHKKMPVRYLMQAFVEWPVEVSVFYYCMPGSSKGVISGFVQKEALRVKGNGLHTLKALIDADPQAKRWRHELHIKHAKFLDNVIPAGQTFLLSHTANLSRGGVFKDLSHHINDAFVQLFDDISRPAQFYYGRYDIKCLSVADLLKGENFTILEYNGCGAEPNHVYHVGKTLGEAQAIWLHHWKMLYEISKHNHEHGLHYWPFQKGFRFMIESRRHFKKLYALDGVMPF